jgi:hypothetical protein
MRHVSFSKSIKKEDVTQLLGFWSSLSRCGTQLDNPVIHQPVVDAQARFIIALARQFQSPALSMQSLLVGAHNALVAFLNQTGNQPEIIDRYLAQVLRDAMNQLLEAGSTKS